MIVKPKKSKEFTPEQWVKVKKQALTYNLFRTFLANTLSVLPPDHIAAVRRGIRRKMVSLAMSRELLKQQSGAGVVIGGADGEEIPI